MYLSGKIGLTSISWRCLGKKDQLQLTEEVWKKKGTNFNKLKISYTKGTKYVEKYSWWIE